MQRSSLTSDIRLLASVLFDIVDRMQLPAAGVFPWARAGGEIPLARSRVNLWLAEITEMLRVPRRSVEKLSVLDQAQKGIWWMPWR